MAKTAGKIIILAFVLLLLLAFPLKIGAEELQLEATADSFVNDAYPDTNYHSAQTLICSHDAAQRWSLVRFDLSSLPEEAEIDNAVLKLYLYNASGETTVPLMVARVTQNWEENTVNWNNKPLLDESISATADVDTTSGYKSWTITRIVRGWQSNEFANFGLGIIYLSGNYARSFRSREHEKKPLLVINYHLPEPTPTNTPSPTATPTPTPNPTATPSPTPTPTATPTPTPNTEATPTVSPPSPSPSPSPSPVVAGEQTNQERQKKTLAATGGILLLGTVAAFLVWQRKKTSNEEQKIPPAEN